MADSQPILAQAAQQQSPDVEYRDIPGYPNYQVGADGTIWRRLPNGSASRKRTNFEKNGYEKVCLSRDGKQGCFYVHCVVLWAFVGPCPEGMQCRHFPDSNTLNNRRENLSWGTPKQNNADKWQHGTARTRLTGEARRKRHSQSLSDDQVIEIRRLHKEGWSNGQLAKRFNSTWSIIRGVVIGKTYRYLLESA